MRRLGTTAEEEDDSTLGEGQLMHAWRSDLVTITSLGIHAAAKEAETAVEARLRADSSKGGIVGVGGIGGSGEEKGNMRPSNVRESDYKREVCIELDWGGERIDLVTHGVIPFTAIREIVGVREDFSEDFDLTEASRELLGEMSAGQGGMHGSFYYFSLDERFIVKQVELHEFNLLMSILPSYLSYLEANPRTSIAHYLGAYALRTPMGTYIHFVVMSNVFYSSRRIDEQYDLKGSWENRRVLPKNIHTNKLSAFAEILKDTDLRNLGTKVQVSARTREDAFDQLKRDAAYLRSKNLMDYSLIFGVHHHQRGDNTWRDDEERPPCIFLAGEEHLYYGGIVDTLQQWNWNKKLEWILKSWFCFQDSLGISSVDPISYEDRFVRAQRHLFLPANRGVKYIRQRSKYGSMDALEAGIKPEQDHIDRLDSDTETQSVDSTETMSMLD